ncbi:MAG: hypothetical protein KIH65_002020 [Candidatus Uhrbacteria bacterium]|nr:hypothetical protein [Candidatus Uhrbacteria bacterium]
MSSNKKFDLGKLQENYFNTSVANVNQANDAIKSAQNWLLILGLAEMSFLSAVILQPEITTKNCVQGILIVLLLAFVLFIFGSVMQYKHLLSSARYYNELSKKVLDEMEREQQHANEIPEGIKLDREQIQSSRIANILLFTAFCLIIFSTIAMMPFILKL